MKIQNAHDKFFKNTFGNAIIAKDFLNNYLPQNLIGLVDVDTLEPQRDSHIDEEFNESFSDLLFKARINNKEGYVYMLFEHKSYPSRDIAFQLLKYMVRIWERKIKELGCLPVIIPLVIYHGKNNWNIGLKLENMILEYNELPEDIKLLIPNYRYLLYDFSNFTDEEIKGEVRNIITIKIMRDIQKRGIGAISEILSEAAILLQQLEDKQAGLEYFEILVRYVFGTRSDFTKHDYDGLIRKIEITYPEGSEMIMTLAEKFREEGLMQGMEKGMEKGETKALARTAIKLLTRKFDSVPENLKQGIAELDVPTLEVIIDNIFEYNSLDDVKKYIQ